MAAWFVTQAGYRRAILPRWPSQSVVAGILQNHHHVSQYAALRSEFACSILMELGAAALVDPGENPTGQYSTGRSRDIHIRAWASGYRGLDADPVKRHQRYLSWIGRALQDQ